MHGQECVSIHTRRISNKPAEDYNPDKATEKAHTCVRATDMDQIRQPAKDGENQTDRYKIYTHVCNIKTWIL